MCVVSPRRNRVVLVCCAAALLAAAGCHSEPSGGTGAQGGAPDTSVTLVSVKHKELQDKLAALRGKIVVVDFWGEF
jgi:hypothetical protein